jgi:N-acyl-D-amino-acid deacylase
MTGSRRAAARLTLGAAALATSLGACASAGSRAETAERTLIVNALVLDGTGAPAHRSSVRVVGDRIAEVGDLRPDVSDRVVDAGGLALAPGFIDTHSHHDRGLFEMRDALAAISSLGLHASAMAIIARCRIPPENWCG